MTFPTEAEARAALAEFFTASAVVVPTTHGYWTFVSPSALKRPANVCSICGQEFREYPNNALPISNGQCCAYCDDRVVTPARIALMGAQ